MHVTACATQHMQGVPRITCSSQFCPTMWGPGIKFSRQAWQQASLPTQPSLSPVPVFNRWAAADGGVFFRR